MFSAFSKKQNRIININDAYDLHDEYSCLNIGCTAKFHIKGVNSDVAPHFARMPSCPHVSNCPYDVKNKYHNANVLVKKSVFDICNDVCHPQPPQSSNIQPKTRPQTDQLHIRTPKQLLDFCLQNDISTPYRDGLTVNDIIIDLRNISNNKLFEGVNGIRMLLGKIIRYEDIDNHHYIHFAVPKMNYHHVLHVTIEVSSEQSKEIRNYLFNTFGNVREHSIAVLGNWVTTKKYHIYCAIQKKTNIIYKFAIE